MSKIVDICKRLFTKKIREIDDRTHNRVGPYDITLCTGQNCSSKFQCIRYKLKDMGGKVFLEPSKIDRVKCKAFL